MSLWLLKPILAVIKLKLNNIRMAVQIFNQSSNKLDENSINDSYANYLHKFIDGCGDNFSTDEKENCAIMSYDEFKEYFILKVLGRSSEFSANMARDYQYLAFDNFTHLSA